MILTEQREDRSEAGRALRQTSLLLRRNTNSTNSQFITRGADYTSSHLRSEFALVFQKRESVSGYSTTAPPRSHTLLSSGGQPSAFQILRGSGKLRICSKNFLNASLSTVRGHPRADTATDLGATTIHTSPHSPKAKAKGRGRRKARSKTLSKSRAEKTGRLQLHLAQTYLSQRDLHSQAL